MACRSDTAATTAMAGYRGSRPHPSAAEGEEDRVALPKTAGRQLGLLRLLAGDIRAAADLLSQAPGLGWSSEEHPGHVLSPSFALLLAPRTSRRVPDAFLAEDLRSMLDSMPVAAERWVDGILGRSRRRQYGHAAMLVASCVALAPVGRGNDLSA